MTAYIIATVLVMVALALLIFGLGSAQEWREYRRKKEDSEGLGWLAVISIVGGIVLFWVSYAVWYEHTYPNHCEFSDDSPVSMVGVCKGVKE